MTDGEKRKIVEAMTDSVVVGEGKITIQLFCLPSAGYAAKGQRRQEGNKADAPSSKSPRPVA